MQRHTCPPDPISHVCSLTGKQICRKCFTYRSVQIFKIMFRRFYSPESDPPHKIMHYWFYYSIWLGFHFHLTESVRWKWFVLAVYQFRKGISAGPALKYLTWFIGAGGYSFIWFFHRCEICCNAAYHQRKESRVTHATKITPHQN